MRQGANDSAKSGPDAWPTENEVIGTYCFKSLISSRLWERLLLFVCFLIFIQCLQFNSIGCSLSYKWCFLLSQIGLKDITLTTVLWSKSICFRGEININAIL